MQVVTGPFDFSAIPGGTAVTMGVFDGVHLGHRLVVERLAAVARETGAGASVLLTFDKHPLRVIDPAGAPPLLTTTEEKISLLQELDIDFVVVEEFTARTAGTGYRAFVEEVLVGGLRMGQLVVGYDFHLGAGREGSQERMMEEGRRLGFGVSIVEPAVIDGTIVSSTAIRRLILAHRLEEAERFLSRPYFFDGFVVRGEGLGSGIGFPTANVEVASDDKLLPPDGVYAVRADVGGRRSDGMMNIGTSPTLHADRRRHMEVHLFGHSGDLYGERMRIHPLAFIREERRFESPAMLKAQLARDRETVRRIMEKKD